MIPYATPQEAMNFALLAPADQLARFYLKNFDGVALRDHLDRGDYDCDYNSQIINPIYQLFAATFSYTGGLMDWVEERYGVGDRYAEINELREDLFAGEELSSQFHGDLLINTSLPGFQQGECWREIRNRTRRLLEYADLLEPYTGPSPIKFRGFLYPDDILEYEPYPHWSYCGQFVSVEEWNSLKQWVTDAYRGAILQYG